MQAVILAGGLGTRLRPLTYEVPKVLVPVASRPFIDWVIESLPRDLFDEVLMLTGHLGEQVEQHCGDGSRYDLRMNYSQEPEPLGTAGALCHAADLLAERFVLLNGDTYIELDYRELWAAHHRMRGIATMALGRPYDPTICPNVRVEHDGRVTRYAKGESPGGLNAVDAGVGALERQILSYIPDEYPSGLEHGVYARLAAQGEFSGYLTDGMYYDIGTVSGLERLSVVLAGTR